MERELRLITSAMKERGAYTAVATVAQEADFSRIGWVLWGEIGEYYDNDHSAGTVDESTIKDTLKVKYSKHFDQFQLFFDDHGEISIPNVIKEYLQLKEDGIRQRLAEALLSSARDDEVADLIDQLQAVKDTENDEDSSILEGVAIEEIMDVVAPENVIPVWPPELAKRLDGGFVGGNQFAVYAPPEVGKSLLSIAMSCHWLRHGYRVFYLGNEDPAKMMLLRFFANLSGMNKHEILSAPKEAEAKAIENGYDNLIFFDAAPGSVSEIRRGIEKYDPKIVIVDQMANMEMGDLGKVEKNEQLSIALRKLAKKYNVVTGIVHQADNDAHGKLVLEKNNMHFSNIGVQSQMDVMIGIGMNGEFEQQNRRMLSLTKNKISGDHSFFPINVKPETSEVLE